MSYVDLEGNDLSTAVTLPFAQNYQGQLTNADVDTFKLTTASAGTIDIDFQHPAGIGTDGDHIKIQLVDENSNVIAWKDGLTGNSNLSATVNMAGDYYIQIIDPYRYTGEDLIGDYVISSNFDAQTNAAYDGASNNDLSTAVDATGFDEIHGAMTNGDTDVFKISTQNGGRITLEFEHPNGIGTTGERLTIQLLDEDSNVIAWKDDVSGNTTLSATVNASGNYFIKVTDPLLYFGEDLIGSYIFHQDFDTLPGVVYDGSMNNDLALAIDATSADAIHGTLTNADVDVFKVSASSAGEIVVNFEHPNGIGTTGEWLVLEVADENGNVLASNTDVRGTTSLALTVDQGGDYYIKVYDRLQYSGNDLIGNYIITTEFPGGQPSAAVLNGTVGKDKLTGTDGDEIIYGYSGNDVLFGGFGNDQLIGGPGKDILIGGEGNDVFLFESLADMGNSLRKIDTITDFQIGDQIDLHLLDANTETLENDTFVFGEGRFTAPGQLRYHSGLQVLYGNVDSDLRSIDFAVRVTGVSDISITDIVL